MMSAALRRSLARLLDEAAFPVVGASLGAAGGATVSDDPTMGGVGGAMLGGMGGYGLRRAITGAAARAFRPTLTDAPIGPRLAGPPSESLRNSNLRVQRRVADTVAPLARQASEALELLNRRDELPDGMGYILSAGRVGDESFFDRRLRSFSARRDTPEGNANATLFGGAPFDPRAMRRLARLSNGDEQVLRTLPNDPEAWPDLVKQYPALSNRPQLARAIIMHAARDETGAPKFSYDQILQATKYGSLNSLKVALSNVNKELNLGLRPRPPQRGGVAQAALYEVERQARAAERAVRNANRAARAEASAQARAERAAVSSMLGVKNLPKMRGRYDEADLINELLTKREDGYYPSMSDVSAALRDDVGEGVTSLQVQLHRLIRYAERAISLGDEAVALLARHWNVTPDKVHLLAQRPWRGQRFSLKNAASRLLDQGVTDPGELQAAMRRVISEKRRDAGASSITSTISAARARRGMGVNKRRTKDALSIVLPYLVTGGVGAAISTVADREQRRRAILRQMDQV